MRALPLFLFLILPLTLFGQEIPPILKFPPSTYKAENQNWSVTQNNDKFIFVANNEGLLEYNGAQWTVYPSPNNTIIRSILAVNGKVYSGSYMEFGYWQRNNLGRLEYFSLSDKIKTTLIEDENFWNIKAYDNWVLFQSFNRIYFYNIENQEINYFTDKNNYYRIFEINKKIYIYKTDGNLYTIENGQENLFAEFPKSYNIQFVLNIFLNNNEITLLTRNQGFFKIKNGILEKWKISADLDLKKYKIYSGIQLQDKSFILGTISNGVIHLSQKGELINAINQSNGLSNNTVLNVFEDVEGNVWAALDNGIDCLNFRSFVREFNDYKGTLGTTYCSIIYDNKLYLGTNQGLFYKNVGSKEPPVLIKGTKGQVWSLFTYDNTLFCGHTAGSFLIENTKAIQIFTGSGVWGFRRIPMNPNMLLIGHYSGLSILTKENDQWKLRNKIKGFENSARFFELMSNQEIWVNHEYKGIYNLKLNKDFTAFDKVNLFADIPKGKGSGLVKIEDNVLYCYEDGIFKLDSINQVFLKDTILSKLILKNEYISGKLTNDKKNRLWAFNKNNISYAEKGPIPNKISVKTIPIQNYWRKTTVSFENITHFSNDSYIVGKTNGYILFDLNQILNESHHVFLNAIAVKRKDSSNSLILLNDKGVFDFNRRSIQFSFSVPKFNKYELVHYQYQLEGLQKDWMPWTASSTAAFEKLPFGDYTFKVRSKVGNKLSNNIIYYKFKISRPWYLSNLAIVLYLLSSILITFVIHRAYRRYYNKQHAHKQLENEQLIMRIKNEQLNQDIESKNRELAISTMSIIKRNQFLSSIKKELKNNQESDNLSVIKLIDKNLNSSKDWKFFEEAFNNADKHFLDKVKNAHPNLTPNDLRFCAYLRLNLSSKEIAPLLNISVRSVEIKRYRLRKKMNLSHDESLINHILEI